ncbi:polyamine ABC transporter substrate-binding protein [Pararhodobacter sp. SW119]|uniref:polyamine ABC transporter substrate-binding protein n=1 Tax=Pararhodobacter sp. SW119 TaxID=2780075 RepID=UPI001ADF68CF|nr:polyamine ABC transporter substrate-binding protein [Pararhodobacter sp. SW119]
MKRLRARTLASTTAMLAMLGGTAQAQGVVNVFNWSDYITDEVLEQFTEETGIRVVYDVYDSNDTLEARLLAGSSGFDVVVPTATFLERQIAAGVYQPLDRDLLPNIDNMDERLMASAASHDPDNAHAVIYMWGTTGIGYNVDMIAERLGEDYEVDSWSLIFDPEIAAQVADCGISFLDSPTDMFPAAMAYLGLDPQSTATEDFEAAAELMSSVRDHVRYFHSSQYISDLANGEICVAVGWSGDVLQAAERAEEAGRGVSVWYAIPEEGAMQWFDMLAIPADAPNPENAHAFINFIMKPEVAAAITNYVWFPNGNSAAFELVDEEIRTDPAIYPSDEVMDKLFTGVTYDGRTDRVVTRLWTRVRTGQ